CASDSYRWERASSLQRPLLGWRFSRALGRRYVGRGYQQLQRQGRYRDECGLGPYPRNPGQRPAARGRAVQTSFRQDDRLRSDDYRSEGVHITVEDRDALDPRRQLPDVRVRLPRRKRLLLDRYAGRRPGTGPGRGVWRGWTQVDDVLSRDVKRTGGRDSRHPAARSSISTTSRNRGAA